MQVGRQKQQEMKFAYFESLLISLFKTIKEWRRRIIIIKIEWHSSSFHNVNFWLFYPCPPGLWHWYQTTVPDTIFLTSIKTLHKLPFSTFGWLELLFSYHLFAKLASTSSSHAIYCIITSQTIPKLYNFSETSYGIAVYVCFQRPIHQFHERKMW